MRPSDCVLLIGTDFPRDVAAEAELLAGLPFLELSLVNEVDCGLLVNVIIATNRHSVGAFQKTTHFSDCAVASGFSGLAESK